MTNLISLKQNKTVAILTMNSDENRHNPEFLAQFNAQLDAIEANEEYKSIVLTSASEKNWSLGIDLAWMSQPSNTPEDNAQFMLEVTQLFKRLISFPVPIIAALNGHVFGNGSVLACACDFRLMKSDKGFFCFPEVDVLVPFFPSMFPLIEKSIPKTFFNRLAMTGQRVGAKELLENNVIEAVLADEDSLQEAALEFAATFNKNRWIYGQNKKQMNKEIIQTMKDEDPDFIKGMSKVLWKMMQKK